MKVLMPLAIFPYLFAQAQSINVDKSIKDNSESNIVKIWEKTLDDKNVELQKIHVNNISKDYFICGYSHKEKNNIWQKNPVSIIISPLGDKKTFMDLDYYHINQDSDLNASYDACWKKTDNKMIGLIRVISSKRNEQYESEITTVANNVIIHHFNSEADKFTKIPINHYFKKESDILLPQTNVVCLKNNTYAILEKKLEKNFTLSEMIIVYFNNEGVVLAKKTFTRDEIGSKGVFEAGYVLALPTQDNGLLLIGNIYNRRDEHEITFFGNHFDMPYEHDRQAYIGYVRLDSSGNVAHANIITENKGGYIADSVGATDGGWILTGTAFPLQKQDINPFPLLQRFDHDNKTKWVINKEIGETSTYKFKYRYSSLESIYWDDRTSLWIASGKSKYETLNFLTSTASIFFIPTILFIDDNGNVLRQEEVMITKKYNFRMGKNMTTPGVALEFLGRSNEKLYFIVSCYNYQEEYWIWSLTNEKSAWREKICFPEDFILTSSCFDPETRRFTCVGYRENTTAKKKTPQESAPREKRFIPGQSIPMILQYQLK